MKVDEFRGLSPSTYKRTLGSVIINGEAKFFHEHVTEDQARLIVQGAESIAEFDKVMNVYATFNADMVSRVSSEGPMNVHLSKIHYAEISDASGVERLFNMSQKVDGMVLAQSLFKDSTVLKYSADAYEQSFRFESLFFVHPDTLDFVLESQVTISEDFDTDTYTSLESLRFADVSNGQLQLLHSFIPFLDYVPKDLSVAHKRLLAGKEVDASIRGAVMTPDKLEPFQFFFDLLAKVEDPSVRRRLCQDKQLYEKIQEASKFCEITPQNLQSFLGECPQRASHSRI